MGKKILVVIATTAVVIGLAASGGGSALGDQLGAPSTASLARMSPPPAQALVNDAVAALKSAHSVRVFGSILKYGKNLHLDVGFVKPASLSGTLSGPFDDTHATVKFRVVSGQGYVLVDKAFFRVFAKAHGLPASVCSKLCGKYVSAPTPQFGHFSLNDLTNKMFHEKYKATPGVTVTSVNGQPAYQVSNGHGVFLYVARNGAHRPLEITKAGRGTLRFTQWNGVPPVTAPPASQVVPLPGKGR